MCLGCVLQIRGLNETVQAGLRPLALTFPGTPTHLSEAWGCTPCEYLSTSCGSRSPHCGRTNYARSSPCLGLPGAWALCCFWWDSGRASAAARKKNMAELGQDIMFLFPGHVPAVAGSYASAIPYYLTYGDYFAIRDQARLLRAVSPVLERDDIRAVSDYGSTNGQVFGVAPEYNQIRNLPIDPGRWFNDEDNSQHRRVAVVGWELLKNMFPGEPAVGSTILLNDMDFKVIGVIPKIGKEGNNGTNDRIFVPFNTMRMLFPLTLQNAENAISFINYRPIKKSYISKPRRKFTRSSGGSGTVSIPASTMLSRTGTLLTARFA